MKFTINCPSIFYVQKKPFHTDLAQALENNDQNKMVACFKDIVEDLDRDQINNV
jgi:hypothetical protein